MYQVSIWLFVKTVELKLMMQKNYFLVVKTSEITIIPMIKKNPHLVKVFVQNMEMN